MSTMSYDEHLALRDEVFEQEFDQECDRGDRLIKAENESFDASKYDLFAEMRIFKS